MTFASHYLPIIRLVHKTPTNATLTDDPAEATAVLYTFLKSVPSQQEREAAMDELRQRLRRRALQPLHRYGSDARNGRDVQALEHTVLDGLLRRRPLVSAAECHRSVAWRNKLYPPRSLLAPDSEEEIETPGTIDKGRGPRPPQTYQSEEEEEVPDAGQAYVRAADYRSYKDPYEMYEDDYKAHLAAMEQEGHASGEGEEDEVHPTRTYLTTTVGGQHKELEYSGSTQPPEEGEENHEEESIMTTTTANTEHAAAPSQLPAPQLHQGQHHPALQLVLQQTQRPTAVEDAEARQDRLFKETVENKLAALHVKLQAADEAVRAAVEEHAQEGNPWSTGHARRKAAVTFVGELKDRATVAANLFQLQRGEQETLQLSHAALLTELVALRLVMRDVKQAVQAAVVQGRRKAGRGEGDAAEAQLLAELQIALSSGSA